MSFPFVTAIINPMCNTSVHTCNYYVACTYYCYNFTHHSATLITASFEPVPYTMINHSLISIYPSSIFFLLDCSLTIEKGSVTGIIGKNGAGKSTLYKAILNLINIDSGNILVFNKDIKELDVKDKADIGVVLADSFFSSYLNIKDIRKIMMDSYETFDVTFFDKKVNEFELPVNKAIKSFSFGMKAKLKMLCALSHNAKILLLDEPTLGLDVIARDEILELLREYMAKDSDNTIMISSHIASDLESLCDDIYMIDDGKIILHEDTDVLLSNYAILKVDDQTYESIDKNYIYKVKKEDYGYALLTNQKQFYYENYPKIVIQNCSIDDVIYMMIKGK